MSLDPSVFVLYSVLMIGVDEVGRGCLAGPLLVVAARQTGKLPNAVRDSKLMSRAQRESMFELLVASAQFGEGWVKPVEIDRLGLAGAMRLGIKRALRQLSVSYHEDIIMDGPVSYFSRSYKKVQCLIDADASTPLVSAASIYAKVRRDDFMRQLAKQHPKYGFEYHVGYATSRHLKALDKFGSLQRVHRQFFEPVYRLKQEKLWQLQP